MESDIRNDTCQASGAWPTKANDNPDRGGHADTDQTPCLVSTYNGQGLAGYYFTCLKTSNR